ncbi:ABC transporter substrate-binding protein [Nitriliruptor alkaliphilus]|uniref:ABC transporter substrate-binding protein n=1 Tax=Nitriliruptor alkaliphilus TaxID=427918 RepID=UPI0006988C63|nr:ABC transporter substrate-binding protein [Nitriliruptor alkaliphilus]
MRIPRSLTLPVVAAVALVASGCGDGGDTVTIGANDFAESNILAQIYGLALEDAGIEVEVRQSIGSRENTFPAVVDGELDLVPEYTGNAFLFTQGEGDTELRDEQEVYDALVAELEADGLIAGQYSPAQDVDGLAVTRETAEEHGLVTISDIADFPGTFRFGGGPECEERISCFVGYTDVYGLTNIEFVSLDSGGPITVEALNAGEVDGANLFTTQSVVGANDFVMLEDDQQLQLPQNIVPVLRQDVIDTHGEEVLGILDAISAALTEEDLIDLNAQVELEQREPRDVAREWLETNGLIG